MKMFFKIVVAMARTSRSITGKTQSGSGDLNLSNVDTTYLMNSSVTKSDANLYVCI